MPPRRRGRTPRSGGDADSVAVVAEDESITHSKEAGQSRPGRLPTSFFLVHSAAQAGGHSRRKHSMAASKPGPGGGGSTTSTLMPGTAHALHSRIPLSQPKRVSSCRNLKGARKPVALRNQGIRGV